MEYHEIKFDIDYKRANQRWDGWGSYDHDLMIAHKMPMVMELLKTELKPKGNRFTYTPSVDMEKLKVPKSALKPIDIKNLEKICGQSNVKTDTFERVLHSAGQSYYDLIRLRFNKLKHYCDGVCYPQNKSHIKKILLWAQKNSIALVPFGGGSSVVGGIEILKAKGKRAVLVIDTTGLNQLVSINDFSRVAVFEAGAYGPEIEKTLNAKGYTLGHFPQSFEYSTIGGWVAARSAGQQSNHYGKIEEMLIHLELITPNGEIKTLNVPAGATGPDINQIVAGSEGLLGIITEVGVKIHELPEQRKYFAAIFPDLESSINFQRELTASALDMSMIRISDDAETRLLQMLSGLGKKGAIHSLKSKLQNIFLKFKGIREKKCLVMCGMEGDIDLLERQEIIVRNKILNHNGIFAGTKPGEHWLKGRFNMPFLRNHIMDHGVGADTLETAVSWENVMAVHDGVLEAMQKSIKNSIAMCHLSHSYHTGACLYFTIIFEMDLKDPVKQWAGMKKAASDAILKYGGNMSHHHGIGADHKSWYEKQSSPTGLEMLRALKRQVDPKAILNPGKLFD